MHMTFEKIDPPEHPAIQAARAIKQLHIDNIAMIDNGFVFHDKDGNSVNEHMRKACAQQMDLCDAIINQVRPLPEHLLRPVQVLLEDAHAKISATVQEELAAQHAQAKIEHDAEDLPEIGNYDANKPAE